MDDKKELKFEDYFSKEQMDDIRQKLEKLFKSKGGFFIIGNFSDESIAGAYFGVCGHDVIESAIELVKDAGEHGMLADCTCQRKES